MSQVIPQACLVPKNCTHCGLIIPEKRNSEFCCAGCECVFKAISGLGLDNFYDIKRDLKIEQLITPKEYSESFFYLDDALFQERYIVKQDDGISSIRFHIDGLHCAACVWLLEHLANKIEGVQSIRVNFPRSELLLQYHADKAQLSKIAKTISSLGYYPRPANAESKKAERKAMLIRLGIAAVSAGNTMMLAISVYQGWFTGIEQRFVDLFNFLSFILALPSVFYCAKPFYQSAWQGLKMGIAHMDLPISIGVLLGFFASCWNMYQGNDHVYFDTICMLIFLLLFGRWLQKSGVDKAEQYSSTCQALLPLTAVKLENQKETSVYANSLEVGDLIRVRTAERLAIDGIVRAGSASLDLSVITGESLPKRFSVGDSVEAGTLIYSGAIEVEVVKTSQDSRIGKLLEKTEHDLLNKPSLVRTTDKVAGYFVVAVLAITSLCAVFWILKGSYQSALENCLAILIISCPCALGMSAPIAISIALKMAAKLGIAVKNSDIFERLAIVNRACLDKTGTLTTGRPVVEDVYFASEKSDVYDLCYSAELEREHPIASALRLYCADNGASLKSLISVEELAGSGLKIVTPEGVYYIGSLKLLDKNNIVLNASEKEYCNKIIKNNFSPCIFADQHKALAIFAIGDVLKKDAPVFISKLKSYGILTEIVSGDAKRIVEQISKQLGIDIGFGEMSPEDKLNHLLSSDRKTLMLGDGINDSAALAAASVGIAVFGGAEQSLKFADAYTNDSKLMPIAHLIGLSKSTLATIKRNIAFSLCYNIVGVSLAFCGMINPLVAAVLMPISSLLVIGSSLMILNEKN